MNFRKMKPQLKGSRLIVVRTGLEPVTHVCVTLQADPVFIPHRVTTLFRIWTGASTNSAT